MELFQLRYFSAAAKRESFSRAADECCVSQPSLSLQISNLEKEVGTQLFVRQGRSVRLTDAGRTLAEYADRILREEEEARRAIRAVMGLERGRLAIWTLPTPGQNLLPPHLAAFRQAHPRIEITVHEAVPARRIGEAITAGTADLGFVHLPCNVPYLSYQELFTEELALVVPVGHPLTAPHAKPPRLSDLAAEYFEWVPEGTTPEHPIYAACIAAGFTPRIACVSGSATGMQRMVAAGLGIAILPRLALHPPEGVAVVELALPRPTRTVAAIWRERDGLTHAANAFLKLVVSGLPPERNTFLLK